MARADAARGGHPAPGLHHRGAGVESRDPEELPPRGRVLLGIAGPGALRERRPRVGAGGLPAEEVPRPSDGRRRGLRRHRDELPPAARCGALVRDTPRLREPGRPGRRQRRQASRDDRDPRSHRHRGNTRSGAASPAECAPDRRRRRDLGDRRPARSRRDRGPEGVEELARGALPGRCAASGCARRAPEASAGHDRPLRRLAARRRRTIPHLSGGDRALDRDLGGSRLRVLRDPAGSGNRGGIDRQPRGPGPRGGEARPARSRGARSPNRFRSNPPLRAPSASTTGSSSGGACPRAGSPPARSSSTGRRDSGRAIAG